MSRKYFLLGFFIVSMATVSFSQAAISQRQLDAIESSLKRIAISNNTVQYLIYDGMTYREVLTILNIGSLAINWSGDYKSPYSFISYVGNYIIFWSDIDTTQNTVVLGYTTLGNSNINHNKLK